MKKAYFLIAILFLLTIFCGAASPQSYSVTGTDMVMRFPNDYAVFGQNGQMNDVQVSGWTEADTDSQVDYMRDSGCLLYAIQMDGYDEIYIDSDSYAESRSMQDFTQFCKKNTGKSDDELLDELAAVGFLRGPDTTVDGYTSEVYKLVTVNGEKYGYAVGKFGDGQYVVEYNTVKNGKAIRLEMYTSGGTPHESQIGTLREIVGSIAYTRGANGFLSQYILGTNGAALLPWIILGIVVIAAVIILIVMLRKWRKKHPKQKQALPQENGQSSMQQNAQQASFTYGAPTEPPRTEEWQQKPIQQSPPYQQPQAGPQHVTGEYTQFRQPMGGYAPQAQAQPEQPASGYEPYMPPASQETETQTQAGPQHVAGEYTQPRQPMSGYAPQAQAQPQQPASGYEPYMPSASQETQTQAGQTAAPQTQDAPMGGQMDMMEMLEKLSELKRQGMISPEEYERKKNELLRRL